MSEQPDYARRLTAADALRDFETWVHRYKSLPCMTHLALRLNEIAELLRNVPGAQTAPDAIYKRMPIEYENATMDDLHLTAREAADYMRTDINTLANMRARGEGIPYSKPSGRVLYKAADVLAAVHASGRGYSRARMETALATFPALHKLTRQEREDLFRHIQDTLWGKPD